MTATEREAVVGAAASTRRCTPSIRAGTASSRAPSVQCWKAEIGDGPIPVLTTTQPDREGRGAALDERRRFRAGSVGGPHLRRHPLPQRHRSRRRDGPPHRRTGGDAAAVDAAVKRLDRDRLDLEAPAPGGQPTPGTLPEHCSQDAARKKHLQALVKEVRELLEPGREAARRFRQPAACVPLGGAEQRRRGDDRQGGRRRRRQTDRSARLAA